MLKKIIGYGLLLGILIFVLKWIEYSLIIRDHAIELYGGLVAALFTVVGIWVGLKLTKTKEIVIVKEVHVERPPDFRLNEEKLKELGISKREYEILVLIAEGHSNKEIADKLFVSQNTIKSHSSNLFVKLDASRRTQAVQRAKGMGLLP